MLLPVFGIWCFLLLFATVHATDQLSPEIVTEGEERLGDQIRAILKHFQQEDPVGLPGAPVPDPMDIPDMKQTFSMTTINFKKVKVYGLSKFRIEHVHSDLATMKVAVAVRIDVLVVRGDYVMSAVFSRSRGGFNVTLIDVYAEGIAMLVVQRNGQLQAEDINMDVTFSDIDVNFENLGFLGSIFQGIINSVGTFIFDSIKPFVLKEVNHNIRGDINKHVEKIPQRFPNSISPLDMAIADARQRVKELGFDPYYVPDYNYTTGLFNIYLTHVWITGLSSFYREGNVTVSLDKNVMYATAHVGTQDLVGKCHWEISFGGIVSRAGTTAFSVDYLQVEVNASQPLDTRKKPKLEDLDLTLGNIQVRMNGIGTLDYLVELVINVLPNVLRYQIVNAIEGPLKAKIQKVLDEVNVEEIIERNIPEIEKAVNLN